MSPTDHRDRDTDTSLSPVVKFIAVAFTWAWGWWGLSILLSDNPSAEGVTTFLGTCSPLVAAWVTWWRSEGASGAWRRIGRCLRPSGGWSTWVPPSLAVLAVLGTASWVQHQWGETPPSAPALWMLAPQLAIMLTVGGGQEEIGWRGWLHPRLRTRFGLWTTPLLVGSIWFCWHLPLWWMPGSIQTHIPMVTFAMMTIGLSMLMARALETSKGGAAVAIWLHALNNLAAGWFIFITPTVGAAQPGAWAMGIGYLVLGAIAMAIPEAERATADGHTTRVAA